jgi:branched-chain amino acid transport system permease protein
VLAVIILGGLDSIIGAIVGGFIIGILENFAGVYLDSLVGGGIKEVVPFVVLVIILMIRPYGIFGRAIIERV